MGDKSTSDMLIKKATGLIQSGTEMSALGLNMLNGYIYFDQLRNINHSHSYISSELNTVPLDQFLISINRSPSGDYIDDIKKEILDHVTKPIEWNTLNTDKRRGYWKVCTLLSEGSINLNTQSVTYRFNPGLIAEVSNPRIFAQLMLSHTVGLRSKHSKKLYETIIDYGCRSGNGPSDEFETQIFKIEDLHKLLVVAPDSQYRKFKQFNSKVIKPALLEISKISDHEVSVAEYLKKSNRVLGLSFYARSKNATKRVYQVNTYTDAADNVVVSKLKRIGLEDKTARHYCERYTDTQILAALNYVHKQAERRQINNLAGYTRTILDNQDLVLDQEARHQKAQKEKSRLDFQNEQQNWVQAYSQYRKDVVKAWFDPLDKTSKRKLYKNIISNIFGCSETFRGNELMEGLKRFDEWDLPPCSFDNNIVCRTAIEGFDFAKELSVRCSGEFDLITFNEFKAQNAEKYLTGLK